jgi:hypothetical protein
MAEYDFDMPRTVTPAEVLAACETLLLAGYTQEAISVLLPFMMSADAARKLLTPEARDG